MDERPYPPAARTDLVERLHGTPVPDPYRWLEDPADERTIAWSSAQDELYAGARAGWPGVAELTGTLRDLLRTGAVGTPTWRGGRLFASRREPDAEHPVLTVTDPGGPRRVLVDPAALDPSGTTTLDGWSPSREGDLVAVQLSRGGTEESDLLVLDAGTGETVDGPIDRTRYSPVAWLPRSPGGPARFYHVRRLPPEAVPDGEERYHRRVYLHTVGEPADRDVEVFGADLPMTSYFGVWTRDDGRWLVVSASDGTAPRTDVWLADLAASPPAAPVLRPVAVGLDAQHSVWVGRDDRLYAHTDLDAPRGRLCVADPARPGHEQWRTLLPEDPTAVLADVALLDGPGGPATLLAVARTRHAVSELALHAAADGAPGPAVPALPGLGSLGGLRTRPGGSAEAWVTYTDDSTPARVLRLDTGARLPALEVWQLPPGEPPDGPPVVSRRIEAVSADGTTVRAVVVTRADAVTADGAPRRPAPTVLYGYGGFGISLTPGYSASVLAWVRAGGTWVTAHLRGGGEEGEAWRRAGMLAAKQNVFDDCHAVAEALVAGGWTTPRQLAVSGGSNGGLLVGAVLTQRPGSVAAALCSAPLLDMVRYHRHGLGATWTSEYGDPDVAEEFAWVHAYSPYHRVVEGVRYPAVLFTVFDGDTRVDPLHARKTCAALQHASASDPAERPVLLRREADVGHGQRALSRSVRLSAEGLAFLAAHTGLEWA
ncbi:MAG: prolyl oligopeptidase family protein [Kineosporiaceae bacterium]